MAARRSAAWAGWVTFAGIMLLLIGVINVFQGFVALFSDERVVVTARNFVLVNMTSWGWTVLLSGLILIVVGAGLVLGAAWARIVGIVVVGLHAATQVAWLGAYPIWSLLMITLDTLVLFALTVRWAEARADLRAYNEGSGVEGMTVDTSYARAPHEAPIFPRRVN
jgi:hypothetical protein